MEKHPTLSEFAFFPIDIHIPQTFPIVKRKDEQKHGHYRTKDKILEIYDAMSEAMKTGKPYQTLLDPPPTDPSVAHLINNEK
ncbi:hypothetical protein [Egbenema bharatensis]|uniref:hypothetical protein n=1 Tax=Egbenema bharatensis TaxID=3463334 RepID=UPI003A8763E6